MARTRIEIAKPDIQRYFDALPQRVLKLRDIEQILADQRSFWRLTQQTNTRTFIEFLRKHSRLRRYPFPFPYRREDRYTWAEIPLLEVLLTVKKDAYFTHYTAMRMHGLTEQVSKSIYINYEQRPHIPSTDLEQGRIDAAFRKPPRVSNNAIEFGELNICLINGMHTGLLGVIQDRVNYDSNQAVNVRLTDLERTLIDITVRPVYSGGVGEVLKAFRSAKERISVNKLTAMLGKLRYAYPYHQAIGFYMERADYRASLLDLIRRFPMQFDFYLANQMGKTDYIKEWRLFVPKGF